jgi:hypothetical protein
VSSGRNWISTKTQGASLSSGGASTPSLKSFSSLILLIADTGRLGLPLDGSACILAENHIDFLLADPLLQPDQELDFVGQVLILASLDIPIDIPASFWSSVRLPKRTTSTSAPNTSCAVCLMALISVRLRRMA